MHLRRLLDRATQRNAASIRTLAELLNGAEKSNAPARSLPVVGDFCSRLEVLPYGPKAAQHYGSIRSTLEKQGQAIGINDLYIAAHARSEGLTLVSNNLREFERVEALATGQLGDLTPAPPHSSPCTPPIQTVQSTRKI